MTQAALTRLWSFLGTLLIVYVVGAWSLSQGGPSIGANALFDARPIVASYYALFFTGPTAALVCGVAFLYAWRSGKRHWAQRLPLAWMSESDVGPIDRGDWATKLYLLFTLLLFVLVPAASLYHFATKVLDHGVVYNRERPHAEPLHPAEILPWFGSKLNAPLLCEPEATPAKASLRLAQNIHEAKRALDLDYSTEANSGNLSAACEQDQTRCRGVDWFPVASPLLMLTAALLGWGGAVALLHQLFFRPRRPKGQIAR